MTTSGGDDGWWTAPVVTLPGGVVIPVDLIRLLFDLEARGIPVGLNAEGRATIAPDPSVTDADRARVRRWTLPILVLAAQRVVVQ